MKYPNGIIIQYGIGSCSGYGQVNDFPIPFPTKCVVGFANAYTFTTDIFVRFYNASKTQFYLDLSNDGGPIYENSCTWMAIGY